MTAWHIIKYIINGGGMVHELPLLWGPDKKKVGGILYILKESIIWGEGGQTPYHYLIHPLPPSQSITYI